MKNRFFKACTAMVLAAALMTTTCYSETDAAKKATIKTKSIKVKKGKTKKITIKNKKAKCTYSFKSNKTKIATVNKKGTVKGIKKGSAVITVKEKARTGAKKTRTVGKVRVNVYTTSDTSTNKPVQTPGVSVTNAPATAAPTNGAVTSGADFYVSPNGNDAGTGKADSPFKTLAKAKEAVKTLPKTKDIVVELADGLYPVSDTINFTSADSGNANCTITYKAAAGAHPVISGGKKLESKWEAADDVNWLEGDLKAYKIPLNRNKKLRAIYVNGERASMTQKVIKPVGKAGSYSIKKDQADWAWNSRNNMSDTTVFPSNGELSADTRNPQNIELDSSSTWARQIVCVDSLTASDNGINAELQMPYAAFAQNLGWGTAYSFTNPNTVTNVFEWLEKPGEFYFDEEGQMLYYIPREGEDINKAEVIVPEIETIIEMKGDKPLSSYVENITFDGISFAYSDWNLAEIDGSHGYASVQGAIIMNNFGQENQHNDIYRTYDVPVSAIHVNTSRNIKFLNGEVKYTGSIGMHLENDVNDIDVTGNYIARTSGAGIVIGHPTHVYENDGQEHQVGPNYAGPDKEKFTKGTESVPKNITFTNNYLLENCYTFSGHSPITSFYTYNLQVLHNFIYKCSYSGMSIGWGWCNFDGYDGTDQAERNDVQLPGIPTTTSKNNHVNYNRVEEICSLLADAGGIYTLGQQGNDDWTEYSEMNCNYINAKHDPSSVDSGKWINGFHPDEGSAYIKFDSNVITNIIKNTYELNKWKRKHDMTVTNSFTNINKLDLSAPNCTVDQYYNADAIWPIKGYETVLNSGLEDKYVYMVGKDVIDDTEYELASNVRLTAGDKLTRRGLLSAADTVWLAPQGTGSFAESDTMVKAAGNEKSMNIPAVAGEYKLYIVYADGRVSDESLYTLYVGEDLSAANVKEGADYSVSNKKPLVLELDESNFSFKLNDKNISNGHAIAEDGRWTLKATSKNGGETVSILFTTSVNKANKLLKEDIEVSAGATVVFDEPIYDAGKYIWLAQSGLSAFDKNDPGQSVVSGDKTEMKAPTVPGTYRLTVTDGNNNAESYSEACVIVK